LAQLHGWSLTTEIDWRNRIKSLEERDPIFKSFKRQSNGYVKIKNDFPDQFGSIDVEKLGLFKEFETRLKYMNMHKSSMDDVLVRGDFWANNIMFEKTSDGSIGERIVGIIDFQMATRGCPMADIGRLMSWSVSPDIRRNHIDQILNHYYKILKSIVGDKLTVSVDRMKNWYDHHFAFNTIDILTAFPTLCQSYVKSEGEQKEIDRMIFIERMKAAYEDAMLVVG